MALAPSIGIVELLALLLFGGGFLGLPFSVPPLPPDPVVERSAPDTCLVHVALRGVAAPDATSANETERLLADEEVRAFLTDFARMAGTTVRALADRQGAGDVAGAAETVALVFATRPASFSVESIEVQPGAAPTVKASLVVSLGAQRDAFGTAVETLVTAALGEGPEAVTVAGRPWRRMAAGPDGPTVTWGFDGTTFIATVGEGTLEALLTRLGDDRRVAPDWKAAIEKRLTVARPGTLAYVDAAAVRKIVAAAGGPDVGKALASTGLDGLDVIAAVSGLSEKGVVSSTWLGLRGRPEGLFAVPAGKPLTAADLAPVPADAVIAQAWKLDLSATLAAVLDGVAKADPEAAEEARRGLEQFRAVAGLDLDRHLLKPLGDTWRVFLLPGGGPLLPQVAVSVSVRDRKTLERTHAALLRLLREASAAPGSGIAVAVRQVPYRGTTLHCLEGAPGTPLPLTPTWCITDDALTITISPQLMRTLLARPAGDRGLGGVPEVAAAVEKGGGALLGYLEPRALVGSLCSLYEMAAGVAKPMAAAEGIAVDPPQLPPMSAIAPHVWPTVTIVRRVGGEGIIAESEGTLPLGPLSSGNVLIGGSPATSAVLVGLLLPAVQSAREAARRAQGMNNMKQLLLAMHMDAAAKDCLPAQAIVDGEGKPLLSWRVELLPYLEQKDLYDQFRRDEPWDSDHNRKLLERMPDVFKAPGAADAVPGMTTYVMPTGPGTLFPRPDATPRFATIADGMSNTLALVEVNADHAVPWTKPADMAVADDPVAPLQGIRPGGFLAGFADGSVRLLPDTIDAAKLLALLTPDGGEPVSPD
jgi:hypothetical protein